MSSNSLAVHVYEYGDEASLELPEALSRYQAMAERALAKCKKLTPESVAAALARITKQPKKQFRVTIHSDVDAFQKQFRQQRNFPNRRIYFEQCCLNALGDKFSEEILDKRENLL